MNSLLEDARGVLEGAGYVTHAYRPDSPLFNFEDDCVLGFLRVFADAEQMVSEWRAVQEAFLRQHTPMLLRDPTKAWNAYGVFLAPTAASEAVAAQLLSIEEDFQSTRKIARAGVKTREELAVALGPLLPIRAAVRIMPSDVHARLLERLGSDGSPRRLLLSQAGAEEIARLLEDER